MRIRRLCRDHFRHFNAATVRLAAEGYVSHLEAGGQMMVTLAGAMSTAELGRSLAPMIRAGKVHAICTTGANLEEDLFNLLAHDDYVSVDWRGLTREQERLLAERGLKRVTDTCIPEDQAMRALAEPLVALWEASREQRFPHEYLYQLIRDRTLAQRYQGDEAHSWLVAASEVDLPLFVPGWADSTLGNLFVARTLQGRVDRCIMRCGPDYLAALADWYGRTTLGEPVSRLIAGAPTGDPLTSVGFFQIGGGIAGDFPICVVPMLRQDLELECVPYWGYFCQIGDSTTSFGSYSGAPPGEKITWGKLEEQTPMFMIESDATLVAPLIFAHVMDW